MISPLAPDRFPEMPAVAGVRLAAGVCGVHYKGRTDLMLAELGPGTAVAGVFTQSSTAGDPVVWCREILPRGAARAVVVNSGNANVFNGPEGRAAVRATAEGAAGLAGAEPEDVYIASTGVIGEPLDAGKIVAALPGLHAGLDAGAWEPAARAIMTTDTFPKGATRRAEIDGVAVTLCGIAKGSGMIAPDMATMLAFAFTDAALPAAVLQTLLAGANSGSFNCITVDSDTSTSDTLLLFATGEAAHEPVTEAGDKRLDGFRAALGSLLLDLAQQVVRDGEGARKFIEVAVSGAASAEAARIIAMAVANSPLVKTAIAGSDANWGRIVMAIGKAGEKVERERVAIRMGGVTIAEHGYRHPDYDEADVARHMEGRDIAIAIDVGAGEGSATVWTCDLTHGYIEINADYRS